VVSTPIHDVVTPYGEQGLVHIASTAEQFVRAIELAMNEDREERMAKVKEFMRDMSWDNTQQSMSELIQDSIAAKSAKVSKAGV